MTQIYRINTKHITEGNEEPISEIRYATALKSWATLNINWDSGGDTSTAANCNGFMALYRKKGHNYLWRGNVVLSSVRERLLENREDLEGTMLLYKAGQNTNNRRTNIKFPIRLSDNRYAFVTGSVAHLYKYAEDLDLIPSGSDEFLDNPAFLLWASEHIRDYGTLWDSRLAAGYAFRKRCWFVWLLETMSLDDYESYYESHLSEVTRAAYCIWKDGEIVHWWRMGDQIHPYI